ncbi:MAG: hypothetical protein KC543_07140 [Myxococcales bacterium]|nr:hypothetical protein [Myxococcales bacterium]
MTDATPLPPFDPSAPPGPDGLGRHPNDGWQLAEPYPLGGPSQRALDAIVRAMLPPPPAPQAPDMHERVATHVRVSLQYLPRWTARGFVVLLHLLNWSPLWRLRAFATCSRLPRETASDVIDGIAQSRFLWLRMLALAPRALVLSTYFDQDEVHAGLGYAPKGFLRERIALRQRIEAGQRAAAADEIHHLPAEVTR